MAQRSDFGRRTVHVDMEISHRAGLDLVKRFRNGADDDALVVPLREISPDTLDSADVHTIAQLYLASLNLAALAFRVGNKAGIDSREGVEQIEGFAQPIPVEVLHDGAAQESITDTALDEIAVQLARVLRHP